MRVRDVCDSYLQKTRCDHLKLAPPLPINIGKVVYGLLYAGSRDFLQFSEISTVTVIVSGHRHSESCIYQFKKSTAYASTKVIIDIDVVKVFLHSQVYRSGTVFRFVTPSTTDRGATHEAPPNDSSVFRTLAELDGH